MEVRLAKEEPGAAGRGNSACGLGRGKSGHFREESVGRFICITGCTWGKGGGQSGQVGCQGLSAPD